MAKVLNPLDALPYEPKIKKNRTEIISLIVGFLLFVLGLSGLPFSNFMGLHLSVLHCITITLAGVILFWNGYLANARGAFWACFGFGAFFGLRAITGHFLGQHGSDSLAAWQNRTFQIAPNFKTLGTADYTLDAILAIVLLAGAFDWHLHHKRSGLKKTKKLNS